MWTYVCGNEDARGWSPGGKRGSHRQEKRALEEQPQVGSGPPCCGLSVVT